jgi:hypothetical protein
VTKWAGELRRIPPACPVAAGRGWRPPVTAAPASGSWLHQRRREQARRDRASRGCRAAPGRAPAAASCPRCRPCWHEYASWPTWPSKAATDAVLSITPRSPSASAGQLRACGRPNRRAGVVAADQVDLDDALEVFQRCRRCRPCWTTRLAVPMPAMFITMRGALPKAASAASSAAVHAGTVGHVAGAGRCRRSRRPRAARRRWFTSSTATFAPWRANSRAVASPRPEPPPVTSATCPVLGSA